MHLNKSSSLFGAVLKPGGRNWQNLRDIIFDHLEPDKFLLTKLSRGMWVIPGACIIKVNAITIYDTGILNFYATNSVVTIYTDC